MNTIEQSQYIADKLNPLRDLLKKTENVLESRGEEPEIAITSLPSFNKKIWGLSRKELVVIGARTSQGKTAFALQIGKDFARQGLRTWISSLEMSEESIVERLFCNSKEVDNYKLLSGAFSRNEDILRKWMGFCSASMNIPMIISCDVGKAFEEVLHAIEILDPCPDVIIIDYVQMIKTEKRQSREDMNEYIRKFRQLTIEKNFCGILCSQVNRGAAQYKSQEPHMAQLKETGGLEEVADKVILLHWEWQGNPEADKNKYKIDLVKNRNGRTGAHYVSYKPQFYKFDESEYYNNC